VGSAQFGFAQVGDFGDQVGAAVLTQEVGDELLVLGLIVLQEGWLEARFFPGAS
jgi:hypothetical protein